MKKQFLIGMVSIALVLFFTGCGGNSEMEKLARENEELRSALNSQAASSSSSQTSDAVSSGAAAQTGAGQTDSSAPETEFTDCDQCSGTGIFDGTNQMCANCSGTGKVPCSAASSGSGRENGDAGQTCTNCGGTGMVTYENDGALGDLKQVCPNCFGTGQLTDDSDCEDHTNYAGGGNNHQAPQQAAPRRDTKQECRSCNGTGKKLCTFCDGLGYISQTKRAPNYGTDRNFYYEDKKQCYHCHGTKYEKCLYCGGLGWTA